MSAGDGENAVIGRQRPSSRHSYARTGRTVLAPSRPSWQDLGRHCRPRPSDGTVENTADHSRGTGRQLRSNTRGHDTGSTSQQAQADSQITPPDTQDTIHLSQARATAVNAQPTANCPSPLDININIVLKALTTALVESKSEGKNESCPVGVISGARPEPYHIRSRASGAEHPEPDVMLRSGWMAGVLGSMPGKATAIPPNDVEILRAKPSAVTSVK
ncbi:hypothetical protein BDD12DRAFT_899677 [Trichophaea hybrida]|nr:hypothetical protein BDD12DRAFT_899677 [Trichophaea hybrida]